MTRFSFYDSTKICALVGIGANVAGEFGPPLASLRTAVAKLPDCGVKLAAASGLYLTRPIGQRSQPHYLNAVLRVDVATSPGQLLRCFKRIERSAGRRRGRANGPRPLDLDILDFGGRVLNWRRAPIRLRAPLVLPHPEMHHRLFVLVPLAEVAPAWKHPALRATARQLAFELGGGSALGGGNAVQRILDSSWIS